MKKVLLLLLNLLFASVVYSQVNPEPGFIITNNNDTIYGTIDYRTDLINSKQCSFKANDKDDFVLYKPNEITGYRFTENGRFYVSKTFEYMNIKYDIFAEYMVNGMLNVYRVKGIVYDDLYFFENERNEVVAYRAFDKSEDFNESVIKKNSQDLFSYIAKSSYSSCEKVKLKKMSADQIINLAEKYHEDVCTSNEDCIKYEYDTKHDKEGVHFVGGVSLVQYAASDDYAAETVWPVLTAGLNIDMKRLRRNMSYYVTVDLFAYDAWILFGFKTGVQFKVGADDKAKFTYRIGLNAPLICDYGIMGGIGMEIPVFNKRAIFLNFDVTSPCINLFTYSSDFYMDRTTPVNVSATMGFKF